MMRARIPFSDSFENFSAAAGRMNAAAVVHMSRSTTQRSVITAPMPDTANDSHGDRLADHDDKHGTADDQSDRPYVVIVREQIAQERGQIGQPALHDDRSEVIVGRYSAGGLTMIGARVFLFDHHPSRLQQRERDQA